MSDSEHSTMAADRQQELVRLRVENAALHDECGERASDNLRLRADLLALVETVEEVVRFTGGKNGCEHIVDSSDQTCLEDGGRSLDAQYTADRVCDPCRLRATLARMSADRPRLESADAVCSGWGICRGCQHPKLAHIGPDDNGAHPGCVAVARDKPDAMCPCKEGSR